MRKPRNEPAPPKARPTTLALYPLQPPNAKRTAYLKLLKWEDTERFTVEFGVGITVKKGDKETVMSNRPLYLSLEDWEVFRQPLKVLCGLSAEKLKADSGLH